MGEIAFNGTYFNKNSKFRLYLCSLSAIASASYCQDMGSTYSYAYNSMETETKLTPIVSPNRLRVSVIHEVYFGMPANPYALPSVTHMLTNAYHCQQKADVGLGPIVKNQERLTVVDFSIPYYESAGLVIVAKREKLNTLPVAFFLEFLTVECWMCVFALILIFILIFWGMDLLTPYSWRYTPDSQRPEGTAILNLNESAWFIFTSCLQQDQWSGSFFVSRYPITERYGTCFLRMKSWGFAKDTNHLIDLIEQNWIVFMESSLASYYVQRSCNMKTIGERIGSWNYGIVLPKNSALTSMLDKALLQLKADSILETIAEKWWIKNNTNCMDLESTGLLLYELGGVYLTFATSIVTSLFLFGLERLVWKLKKVDLSEVS
ncbi:unnamed protein product [Echinostoma caproni]|uniref:PBPe domain-containing protein n=1 Tax=Echinostoma caproni TaxID=27848 RepID=A0A183AQH1_9TREM|nr:unnamed protein product [Echinostoma caproni]